MSRIVVVAIATLGFLASASAQLIYDQPVHPNGQPGGDGYSIIAGGAYDREVADDFTLPGTSAWSITQVDFTVGLLTGEHPIGGFNINLYADAGGSPGGVMGAFNSGNSYTSSFVGNYGSLGGLSVWYYLVNIPKIVLAPGVYWLGLQAVDPDNTFWLTADSTNAPYGSEAHVGFPDFNIPRWTPGSAVFGVRQDMAFSIHGHPVPEPFTMGLAGLALAAAARRRLRRCA